MIKYVLPFDNGFYEAVDAVFDDVKCEKCRCRRVVEIWLLDVDGNRVGRGPELLPFFLVVVVIKF